jgi:predicted transcriptional regulator
MTAKKTSLILGVRMDDETLTAAQWLAKDTKRTRNGAINWAISEIARQRGYQPEVTKKKRR